MKLYKYCPPERIDFFPNFTLRATPPNEFNDIYEAKVYISKINSESFVKKFVENTMDCHLNNPDAIEQKKKDIQAILYNNACKILGIICFSENYDNLLMWSHYTDNHKGFVIEFDFDEDSTEYLEKKANDKGEGMKKVVYSDKIPTMDISDFEKMKLPKDVWFTKSKVWNYEEEVRLALHVDRLYSKIVGDKEITNLKDMEKELVVSITLGVKMKDDVRNKFKEILKSYPLIKLYQAKALDSEYKIIRERIKI